MKGTNDYIDNQIEWVKNFFDAEIRSVRDAVDKVEKTGSDYRATQNEWRAQMKDRESNFVTRRELWGAVVAIIGIVIGLLSYFK
jgi:hypothetical protein